MTVADQLTVARICAAPVIVLMYVVDFPNHAYWATAVFAVAMSTDWLDGRLARRSGRTSALGSLLDPIADKVLVLSVLIVLIEPGPFPAWMVAAIVAREFLVSGLRLAALERGVVLQARDLGVDKIRETGRSAQGVTLIRTGDDDRVTSATLLAAESDEEE